MAVVVVGLVAIHGIEYLFPTVILCGLLQVAIGIDGERPLATVGDMLRTNAAAALAPHAAQDDAPESVDRSVRYVAIDAAAATRVPDLAEAETAPDRPGDFVEVNVSEDPHYHVATDRHPGMVA